MDPDPAIKQNRLNLLGVLRNHARLLADFGAIVKAFWRICLDFCDFIF